jgi:hypothetical protein
VERPRKQIPKTTLLLALLLLSNQRDQCMLRVVSISTATPVVLMVASPELRTASTATHRHSLPDHMPQSSATNMQSMFRIRN